jgi:hypothetical protein
MHHVQRSTKQRFVTGSLLVPAAMLVIAGTLSGDPQNFIPSGTSFPNLGGRLTNLQHGGRRH